MRGGEKTQIHTASNITERGRRKERDNDGEGSEKDKEKDKEGNQRPMRLMRNVRRAVCWNGNRISHAQLNRIAQPSCIIHTHTQHDETHTQDKHRAHTHFIFQTHSVTCQLPQGMPCSLIQAELSISKDGGAVPMSPHPQLTLCPTVSSSWLVCRPHTGPARSLTVLA